MEHEQYSNPWVGDRQSPAYRRDLAEVLGLVVGIPSFLYPNTTENPNPGVDILDEHRRLIVELEEEIVRRASTMSLSVDPDTIRHHPYDIGQAGKGGPWPFSIDLVEIAANVNAVVQTSAGYAEVGILLLETGRWWKNRLVSSGKYNAERDRPLYLPESIRLMCIGHAHEQYRIRPKAAPHGYVRPGPSGSLDHPTGNEWYTVAVPASRKTYIYLVNSNGMVADHYVIEAGRITGLDVPDWFGDARMQTQSRQAIELHGGPGTSDRSTLGAA